MTTLDRYMARTLLVSFVLALAGFVVIFSVIALMEELRSVGQGSYTLGNATWFVLMRLPAESFELFPGAALVGFVMGLSAMAAHGEIVAMQASGVSYGRIAASALQAAAVAGVAMMLFGELVAAPLARSAHVQRSIAISGGRALSSTAGFWIRSDSSVVNVRNPFTDGTLNDLFLFDFDDADRLRSYIYARSAFYTDDGWNLSDVVETTITEEGVDRRWIASHTWHGLPEPRAVQSMLLPAEDMSVAKLRSTIETLDREHLLTHRYELAFWRRVTTPVVALVMISIAIPLVLQSAPRSQRGRVVILAALAGVGFQMLNQTFATLALVYRFPPLVGATAPGLAALLVGVWQFRKLR